MMRRRAWGGLSVGLCVLVAMVAPGVASAGERGSSSNDTVA